MWLSRDPVAEIGGINLTSFGNANAVQFYDPYGLWAWDDDLIELGILAPLGFGSREVVQASREGFSEGYQQGSVVIADAATFGQTAINESATRFQEDASQRGDIISQIGFGAGKVGVEAGYMAVGAGVLSKASKTTKAAAFLLKHQGKVRALGKAGTVLAAGSAGWNTGQSIHAAREGDWNQATVSFGRAGISAFAGYKGAKAFSSGPPKGSARYVFDARSGQYRDLTTGRFVSPKNLPWPRYPGFTGKPKAVTLQPGKMIDRFGSLSGEFAGTPGASASARGLPAGSELRSYIQLKVLKPLPSMRGPVAGVPEFGARGGSIQYWFKGGIQPWIDSGHLGIN